MQRDGAQRYGYLLLGCFVALGLLAKLTFATVLLPVLCVFATARAAGYIERPRITDLIKAMVLALLLAAPWYALNVVPALQYASYSSHYIRHSLPYSSALGKLLAYAALVLESGFGDPLAALGIVVCGVAIRRRLASRREWGRERVVVLLACAASAFALFGTQLLADNHNPRFMAPVLVLAGAAVAILAGASSLTSSRRFSGLSACLVSSQIGLMLTHWDYDGFLVAASFFGQRPSAVFLRQADWDWRGFRTLCLSHLGEQRTLNIGHLGSGSGFNPPQIV